MNYQNKISTLKMFSKISKLIILEVLPSSLINHFFTLLTSNVIKSNEKWCNDKYKKTIITYIAMNQAKEHKWREQNSFLLVVADFNVDKALIIICFLFFTL